MEADPWRPLCGDEGRELQGISSLLMAPVFCTRLISQSPDLKVTLKLDLKFTLSFPLQASPFRSLFRKTMEWSLQLPSLSHTLFRSVIFGLIRSQAPYTGCCHKSF